MDETQPSSVDAVLQVSGLDPEALPYVADVLARVNAGLAMEGYAVCLHMHPTLVSVAEVFSVEDWEGDDGQ